MEEISNAPAETWSIALVLIVAIVAIIPTILWIWAIVSLVQNKVLESTTKIVWAIVIIFVPFIGSLLYLIVGRRQS